jgi:hypothetical protein
MQVHAKAAKRGQAKVAEKMHSICDLCDAIVNVVAVSPRVSRGTLRFRGLNDFRESFSQRP